MIDAGLPLVQCLEILSSQGDNKAFNAILKDVKNTVEHGATFSDALKRHPKVFDELFVNLVHAGEIGGILDTILNRLAVYIEKRVKLQRQVRGALVYPIAVFVIAVVVMTVLLTFVIPAFENMFKDFGGKDELPRAHQVRHRHLARLRRASCRSSIGGGIAAFFGITLLVPHAARQALLPQADARASRSIGPVHAQDRRRALHAHARHAARVRRADPRRARHRRQDVRQRGDREALIYVARRISEGKNMAEPLAETKVFPAWSCR